MGAYFLVATPMKLWKSLRIHSQFSVPAKRRGFVTSRTSSKVGTGLFKQVGATIKFFISYILQKVFIKSLFRGKNSYHQDN